MEIENTEAVRALEENLWSLWSRFGRGEGCVLHERPEVLRFDTPIHQLPYNTVLRFIVAGDPDRQIDDVFDHYRRRDVPFMWIVHPSARPLDLGDRLARRGLVEAEVCPGMCMQLAALPALEVAPPGIEIRETTAQEDIAAVLEMVAWRWDVPVAVRPALASVARAFDIGAPDGAVRCWVAWKDGTPVSKVILHTAAGAAGIYGVATRPEARGLGLARTLTLAAFHAARRDGQRIGVLHSTPMAQRMYEKLGFRAVAPFRIFAPPTGFHV
jgi:GNAT superfamily N-acetyltransferase